MSCAFVEAQHVCDDVVEVLSVVVVATGSIVNKLL